MNGNTLSNPIDRYEIKLGCIGALVLIIIGAVPALLTPVFIALPVMTFFAALDFFGIYRKHVKMRPTLVTVRDDGLVLEFRSGKERFLQWSDIKDVHSGPRSEMGSWKSVRSGAFRVNGQRTPYLITHEISSVLTERYTRATGRPPVIWNGQAAYQAATSISSYRLGWIAIALGAISLIPAGFDMFMATDRILIGIVIACGSIGIYCGVRAL